MNEKSRIRIVGALLHGRRLRDEGAAHDQQRGAVRRGSGDMLVGDKGARAGPVLRDDLLAEASLIFCATIRPTTSTLPPVGKR